MLDLGFLPDVERLLSMTPAGRHTMLFSATMPGAVVALARRYMSQPTHIRASEPDDAGAIVKAIKQHVYRAHAMDKVEVLARILQSEGRGLSIVFTRTKRTAAKVADELIDRGFAAGAIHGDLGQGAREQALRAFRNGKVDVLVATDVAARGIDVDDVTHVVNYQCTEDEKIYVHRIGRTGRAGRKGVAVTFVDWDDMPRWGLINKAHDIGIPEPLETYSTSPHLYTDLGIPEGTTGTPAAQQADTRRPGRRGARGPRRDRQGSRRRTAVGTAAATATASRGSDRGRSRSARPRRPSAARTASARPAAATVDAPAAGSRPRVAPRRPARTARPSRRAARAAGGEPGGGRAPSSSPSLRWRRTGLGRASPPAAPDD